MDPREPGEVFGIHRVARIMREHKLKVQRGYKAPREKYIRQAEVFLTLAAQIHDMAAVYCLATDLTYIRTYQDWLYLALVLDRFAKRVAG